MTVPHNRLRHRRLDTEVVERQEQFGVPSAPADLRKLSCIAIRENDEDVTLWRFTDAEGEAVSVRIEPRLASNDGEIVREWALQGQGIVVRSEWSVGRAARTQAFVKHLRDALTPVPWQE